MRILFLVLATALLFGCAFEITKIEKIKSDPDKYLGEKVTLKGTVEDSVKLGDLSGFSLNDGTGKIFVSSGTLPPEGKEVMVQGTLMKQNVLFTTQYYILAKEVS